MRLLLALLVSTSCVERPFEEPRVSAPIEAEDPPLAGTKGLPVSSAAPSFVPTHVTGPNAGGRACPLCVLGNVPQLQIWAQESHFDLAARLAQAAEGAIGEAVRTYVILVPARPPDLADATSAKIRAAELGSAFVVRVPSWDDPETGGLYGHSALERPIVRVYAVVNRRVFARWDDPAEREWKTVFATAKDSAKHVADHLLTDAMIAPPWEPGTPLRIRFQVVDPEGKPRRGQKVKAWQTDASGLYNPRSFGHRVPRLETTAWTDERGEITFTSIYPGSYPGGVEPSHVHFAFPGEARQWRTLWFEGDPLLTPERRAWADADEETVIVPLDRTTTPYTTSHRYVLR